MTALTFLCPNFKEPFVLQTDASSVDLSAVLTQTIEGEERVIAFASRALADPEKKYFLRYRAGMFGCCMGNAEVQTILRRV